MHALSACHASSGELSRMARAEASQSAAPSCQPTHTLALKFDFPPGETLPERVGASSTGAPAGLSGSSSDEGRAPAQATRRKRATRAALRMTSLLLGAGIGGGAIASGLGGRFGWSGRPGTPDRGAGFLARRLEAALQRITGREVGELLVALRRRDAAPGVGEAAAAGKGDAGHGAGPRKRPGQLFDTRTGGGD